MTEKSEKLRFAKVSALLCTIVFMAYYFYGLRAFLVALTSVFSSVLADYLCCAAMKKKYDWADESPVMSGLLLALLMPASVPYTIMAFAAAFMAIICKHAFGGNKNLIFCPVCIAYIFTTLCFPSEILRYPSPAPFGSVSLNNIVSDTLGYSYTYTLDTDTSSSFSLLDLVWGKIAGPMGSAAILIILICAVALYFFGDIPTVAIFSGFAANVFINVIFPVGETGWYAVLNSLVAGSYFFVLVFMACDPRYVPKRAFSQLLFGVIFAGASYLIRRNTSVENGAVFALPMLCVFRDELDRFSSALEKLLKLIRKYTKIFVAWLGKSAVSLVKICFRQLGRSFKYIVAKITELKAKRSAEEDTEVNESDIETAETSAAGESITTERPEETEAEAEPEPEAEEKDE